MIQKGEPHGSPLPMPEISILLHPDPLASTRGSWPDNFKIRDLAPYGENWHEAANAAALAETSEYLLLLADSAALGADCIAAMAATLASEQDICGINPVFLNEDHSAVTHMGFAADSQLRLCWLYEGINPESPLAAKRRRFQLAAHAALLIRTADFRACGGFHPESGPLCFFDFCRRLTGLRGGAFTSLPRAFAIHENQIASFALKGLWDSICLRGKMPPGTFAPDYADFARSDGIPYLLTDWLAEYAAVEVATANAWLDWRRSPEPRSLLRWLSDLPPQNLPTAIEAARAYPAILPGEIRLYEVLSVKIADFAREHDLPVLEAGARNWRKRSFHHGALKKGIRLLQEAGLYNASLDRCPGVFSAWLELTQKRNLPGAGVPEIAVIMPVYDPEPRFLREALESVLAQEYGGWQLCIADDHSPREETRDLLREYAARDPRIRLKFRSANGGISEATNSAIDLATAPWIAFMDQDDLLAPDALAEVARRICSEPGLHMIFSDEDHVDQDNIRRSPVFRAGRQFWPTFAIGHLCAYSTEIVSRVGLLRTACDGSQDYDLFLRVLALSGPDRIGHIPKILYHWRVHPGSTAGSVQTKPYVFRRAQAALEDYSAGRGFPCEAVRSEQGTCPRPVYDWPGVEAALVFYGEGHNALPDDYGLKATIRIIQGPDEPDPGILRDLALATSADVFLFLDRSARPAGECRLEQLLILAAFPQIALAGATLWQGASLLCAGYYPDENGRLFPLLQGASKRDAAFFCWGELGKIHEAAAIPAACFGAGRKILESSEFAGFANSANWLTELALIFAEKGLYTVVSPLVNLEARPESCKCEQPGGEWRGRLAKSPLRNPNLRAAPDLNWTLRLPD